MFVVLNECFAKDDKHIFAGSSGYEKGGMKKLENTDNVEVLDSGMWEDISPAGYIKSGSEVFYYHMLYENIIEIKEADAASFISMNDGVYAKDKNYAYAFGKALKKNTPVEIIEYNGERIVNVYGKIIDVENMSMDIPKVCIKLYENEYAEEEFKKDHKINDIIYVDFNKLSKISKLD